MQMEDKGIENRLTAETDKKGGVLVAVKTIITVGRQYGSGGRYVAKLLAEKLGIPYYDKELMAEVSRDSGICKELLEEHDEKNTRSFLFSMMSGAPVFGENNSMYMDMPLNHRIFLAQFDTIRRIAGEGPCVIVGRCADYVLRDEPHTLNVFIKADKEDRIRRMIKYYGVDPLKAEEVMKKADKQRASYYNYYATNNWGDVDNYDLCVDTGALGIEGAVELIAKSVEIRENYLTHKEDDEWEKE